MTNLIQSLLSNVLPIVPGWALRLAYHAIVEAIRLVKSLEGNADIEGAAKRAAVVAELRRFFDEGWDDVPGWSALDESARDRILDGVTELALLLVRARPHAVDGDGVHAFKKKIARVLAERPVVVDEPLVEAGPVVVDEPLVEAD